MSGSLRRFGNNVNRHDKCSNFLTNLSVFALQQLCNLLFNENCLEKF